MAVINEFYRQRKDGVNLYKTYSDANFYIQKVGTQEKYSIAIDIENCGFEYIETEEQIPIKEEKTEE